MVVPAFVIKALKFGWDLLIVGFLIALFNFGILQWTNYSIFLNGLLLLLILFKIIRHKVVLFAIAMWSLISVVSYLVYQGWLF